MEPLNAALFASLQRVFQDVRISKPGETARVTRRPRYESGRVRLDVSAKYGEYYRVNCPFCGDRRKRLYFSYLWGTRDERTGQQLRHLVICYNERCVNSFQRQEQLFRMLGMYHPCDGFSTADANIVTPATPKLPQRCGPIIEPAAADAQEYLRGRGFDAHALWRGIIIGRVMRMALGGIMDVLGTVAVVMTVAGGMMRGVFYVSTTATGRRMFMASSGPSRRWRRSPTVRCRAYSQ